MLSILLSIHWADSVTFKVIWMKIRLWSRFFFFLNAQLLGCKMVLITGIFSPFYTCKLLPHLDYFFLIFPDFNYNHNLLLFNKVIWKLFCIRLVLNSPVVIEGEMCESKTGANIFLYIQYLLQIGSSLLCWSKFARFPLHLGNSNTIEETLYNR